jgi:hypothetical protein
VGALLLRAALPLCQCHHTCLRPPALQPLLTGAACPCCPLLPGKEVLYDWHNAVVGVATGDMGIAKDGSRKPSYTPGVDLMARLTMFGEGARGSLSEVRGSWGVGRGQGWQCGSLMCASFVYLFTASDLCHTYLLLLTLTWWSALLGQHWMLHALCCLTIASHAHVHFICMGRMCD